MIPNLARRSVSVRPGGCRSSHAEAWKCGDWGLKADAPPFPPRAAFDRVCLQLVLSIKRALEIGGVKTSEHAWRGIVPDRYPAQVDMLIDRNDGIVDLCEMKYTKDAYALSEEEWNRISRRRAALREVLPPSKAIHVVMVTAQPIVRNAWSKEVMAFVTADDLFNDCLWERRHLGGGIGLGSSGVHKRFIAQ